MRKQGTREQIQCPSCGRWNIADEAICGGCGRILQVQAKPPVDYRRWVPIIILAVVILIVASFWGYLKFTVADAEKKIASQDYEAAANELMKISFYKKADEMLQLPEIEKNCASVVYARAQKLYQKGDYFEAMKKLVAMQTYEDSGELLRKCVDEFFEGSWSESEVGNWGVYFSPSDEDGFSMKIWDSRDESNSDKSILQNMNLNIDGADLTINMHFSDELGFESYYQLTNIMQNYFEIDGIGFQRG